MVSGVVAYYPDIDGEDIRYRILYQHSCASRCQEVEGITFKEYDHDAILGDVSWGRIKPPERPEIEAAKAQVESRRMLEDRIDRLVYARPKDAPGLVRALEIWEALPGEHKGTMGR